MTDEPWTLPIDALVMSVGGGLGDLADAVDAAFPSARLLDSGFENATPDAPVLRELREPSTSGIGPWLAVLATPHSGGSRVTFESIAEATTAAVRAAMERRALRIGMPMIATGALGEPYAQVADVAVPSTMLAADQGVQEVVFFARSEDEAVILRAVTEAHLGYSPAIVRPDDPERREAGLAGVNRSGFDPGSVFWKGRACHEQAIPAGSA